ncbi:hypothetical protein N7510_006304 [Penicillium lagena]|uniref:uncharacterized protein n=1 Tax=Penicillium lagena TaxID=94218 RepID=UPI002542264C|nr:uncharacterized protein N7510_006304 [Penicillium lagena]KAJ5613110.1 hypothetical protein N7510_006304 [Penicillium lagena]
MFRASLRSVSDPLRDHVCLSCLARRVGSPNKLRAFHSTPLFISRNKKTRSYFLTQTRFRGYAAATQESPDGNRNRKASKTLHPDSQGSIQVTTQPLSAAKKFNRQPKPKPPPEEQERREEQGEQEGEGKKEKRKIPLAGNTKRKARLRAKQKKKTTSLASAQADKKASEKNLTEDGKAAEDKKEKVKEKRKKATEARKKAAAEDARAAADKEKKEKRRKVAEQRKARLEKMKAVAEGGKGATDMKVATDKNQKKKNAAEKQDTDKHQIKGQNEEFTAPRVTEQPNPPPPGRRNASERKILPPTIDPPGVYHLRDPRSRVYNFDPYLGSIMPVTEFDFEALKAYITSSKDETLRDIAVKHQKKYVGSSSSMTSVLSHFHYLLSSWRAVNVNSVSQGFSEKLRSFTRLLRSPAAMFLRYQDGVYAIDADKEFDNANILMNLGKSMEKLLTLPKDDFERYRRSHENKITPEEEEAVPESYHFTTYGDFIMRSQLDAYDPRLPGTGMFDLKTRAVVSIRMDAKNFEHGLGYEIKGRFGDFESFEREYFDMIRAAFLKYSLQVRVGRMDGIFVAFHNIERIFGFQYISLAEMDEALHGQSDTALGDEEFKLSLGLWNKVLDKATARFPKQSLRFHFETRDATSPFMYIFAEPVTDEEIDAIQTKNQAEIEAYQKRLLHPESKDNINDDLDAAAVTEETSPSKPSEESEALSSDTNTPESPSEASSAPIYDSDAPPDPSFTEDLEKGGQETELLGMVLSVKNRVNKKPVDRPTNFKAGDEWTVDYELNELEPYRARNLYEMCQRRRRAVLDDRGEDEIGVAANAYIRQLREVAKQGRSHREKENELDEKNGVVVFNEPVH